MTGVNIVASYGDDFFHISRNASIQVSCIQGGVCSVMWPDLYLFYEQNVNSDAFWLQEPFCPQQGKAMSSKKNELGANGL